MDLNKAMIIGNVTQDPEVRTTPSGLQVVSFSVATNLTWTDQSGMKQSKVEYHSVVAWRRLAEICGQYLRKGKKVYIEGRLQTRDWEDQNGVRRYKTEIVADNMIMLDRGGSMGDGGAFSAEKANQFTGAGSTPFTESTISSMVPNTIPGENAAGVEEEIKVENIPF